MNRRTPTQIAQDRNAIVALVAAKGGVEVRPTADMRATDIDALVKQGRLVKTVRKEWDSQTGYSANLFGGAGVMIRHRAYLALGA